MASTGAESTWVSRVQRAVLQNIGLKTFSLLVSIGLFTVVHGSDSGQSSVYVPVVAILPPESSGQVLVSEIPDKVKLTLSGSRSVLNSVGSTLHSVQIDLREGAQYYAFEPDTFGLPAGIDVQVTPAALTLAWEKRLDRSLPVRAQLSGTPDPALELVGKPAVVPVRLTVSGPKSLVEAMTEIPTEPVPIGNLGGGNHRRSVPLMPLPKHVATSQTGEVTVEVTLEPKRAQRRLRRLPVAVMGLPGVFTVRPQHVDVVVAAPEAMLDELDPEHVVPVAEVSGDNNSAGVSIPVSVRGLNEGVRVIRIEPSEVLVRGR